MRRCDTCSSPYVQEIDQMINAGWTVREIQRVLKGKYPDAKLPSYDSLRNHKRHLEDMIDKGVKTNEERKKIIQKEIDTSILAVEQLRRNLEIASNGIEKLWSEWIKTNNFAKLKDLSDLITSTNRTIELLLKFNEEIRGTSLSEDDVFERLMSCLYDLPIDLIQKIKERWESYGKK